MKNYWLLCILLALNGCGGGGGGGTSSGGSTVSQPVGDAASFEPAKVTVSYEAGSSKPIDIVATIKRPTDFAGAAAVYTLIKDSAGVISTEVSISALSSTSYKVVLNTSNTKAAGHYTGAFTIMFCRDTACASQFPGSPMALPFDITVATPPLHAAAAASLDLNMRAGDTAPVTVPVNITGVGLQWTATGSASWLTLSPASGTGPGTLTLSYNGTGLAPGQYTQTVRIATADGQSASLPVSMTVLANKLLAGETGVALSATPAWSRLSRVLAVSDAFDRNVAWTALSDQSWLTVTPGTGATAATLTLSANSASLPVDTVSYATVTISSSDPTITAPELIKVGIWKGSGTPFAVTKLSRTYSRIIADPVRPYVYVHNGGTDIDVFNVYTGAQIASLSAPGAPAFGPMAISPNGAKLFALDMTTRTMQVFDLATQTSLTSWNAPGQYTPLTMLVVRPNGVEVLLVGDGTAYLAATGKQLSNMAIAGEIAASSNGLQVYAQDTGSSPSTVTAFTLDYLDAGGGILNITALPRPPFDANDIHSNGKDIAVSGDGTRLYTANGSPYRCALRSPADLHLISYLPGGDAYPNNVKVASDGRVYCGIAGAYSEADVWVHRADGTLQNSFKFAGYAKNLLDRQMAVSSDGLMLIALTDDPKLVFVPVGP